MSKHSCVASFATALLLVAAYPSCASDTPAAPADGAATVARYARASAYDHPALSPDARRLGYVIQEDGQQIVIVLEIDSRRQRRTLQVVTRRERVRWCDWSDARYLLCGTIAPVRAPDHIREQTRLYALDAVSGSVRELNARSSDAVRDQIIDVRGSRPGVVLVQYDPLARGSPEVAELDVTNGELHRVVRPHPRVQRWMSDGRGTVRLGIGYRNGIAVLYVRNEDASWRVLLEQSIGDPEAVGPLAFGALPHELYVLKQYRGRTAVFLMDLRTGSLGEPLLMHEVYDVTGPLWLHPSTRELLAARFVAEREEIRAFASEQQQQRQWLEHKLPGTVNLAIDSNDDATVQLIRASSDVEAPSLYLFDTRRPALTLLGHEYPELEGTELAAMRPMTYRARDGQAIAGYLTLPSSHANGQLPAVVLPHGGPESRVWLRSAGAVPRRAGLCGAADELPWLVRLWGAVRHRRGRAVGRRDSQRHHGWSALARRAWYRRPAAPVHRRHELRRLCGAARRDARIAVVRVRGKLCGTERPAGTLTVCGALAGRGVVA